MNNVTLLIGRAIEVSRRAYAPYSQYRVGAALGSADGQIFTGCNVENAAYPAGICAERGALMKAISEGVQQFDTLVVATQDGGSPCGICRQMLAEFSPKMRVICVKFSNEIMIDTYLEEMLPYHFTTANLQAAKDRTDLPG